MSLLPRLLEELTRPTVTMRNQYDQRSLDNLMYQPQLHSFAHYPALMREYHHIPHRPGSASRSGMPLVQNSQNHYKVNLDVQQFKPEEISVKVVDGYIVVDGKHEERSDEHGFISRQFTRRYKVPDDVDTTAIASTLSSDGVLSVGAPKKTNESSKGEIPIQIIQTNEPSIKPSQNKEKENGGSVDISQ